MILFINATYIIVNVQTFFVVMNQVAYTDPFNSNIWNSDAAVTSDEEIGTSSYLRASSVNSSPNSFPPLIEVPRQDQQ